MIDQTTPATQPPAPAPLFDRASALPIAPRRDPQTARTVCFLSPAEADQVHLWSAGRRHVRTAPAAEWPADPQSSDIPAAEPPQAAN